MNGKIISSNPHENDVVYRVEIFEDEEFTLLVGEANIFGSGSFSRERQYLNKTMIKRYAKSVANRRGLNFPWFISDELAQRYGINTELPAGISEDMKPLPISGNKQRSKSFNGNSQMPIDDFFINSSAGFLADERSVSPPPPQFSFPCDDAVVPVELIDPDLKYPDLAPVNQFISDSDELSRSLSIWTFCQTFSSQLKLSPFSYDDWEEALTCKEFDSSNPIIEETFLALLSTLMKDRRNLTKGAFADKLKSAVLTFKSEIPFKELAIEGEAQVNDKEDEPEIVISSGEDSASSDEDEGLYLKRSRNGASSASKTKKLKSLLLPSIDLRKHRWYETRAMEYWHFVLGAFYFELIDMVAQLIAEEESKEAFESEGSSSESEDSENEEEAGNDSAYEEEGSEADGDENNNTGSSDDSSIKPKVILKQLSAVESPLEVMRNFIKIYEPISEELTSKGSKEMFSTYLNLPLSSKLALLEFLVHNHHDRDAFKAFVEDCLERQGDARRLRKEVEIESRQASGEVERLEDEVLRLKEDNLKITERLEAGESDIEMSEGDSDREKEQEHGEQEQGEQESDKSLEQPQTLPPLTEIEREELIEKRNGNKKEITGLNAQLRKLRPEATALQRKSDAVNRDLRKCSSFRTFSLGQDRFSREYWWFGDFVNPLSRLLVFDSSTPSWIGSIDTYESFELLMEWLNPLGIREAKLKAALMEIEEDIKTFISKRDIPENRDPAINNTKDQDTVTNAASTVANASDSEEVDFDSFRRGRGRPPKGSSSNSTNPTVPQKRPFQKYKNSMS